MPNFFYYDTSGQKVGPMTSVALKALAQQGVIKPETTIENEHGRTTVASQVKGLVFPKAVTPQEAVAVPLKASDIYAVANAKPVESNPFTGALPVAANPFVASVPVSPFAPTRPVAMVATTTIKTLENYFKLFWIGMAVGTPLALFGTVASVFGLMVANWGGRATPNPWGGGAAPLFIGGGGLVLFLSCCVLLGAAIFMFMLIYQLWKVIPPHIARTTPGKAVGFMFIPFFNCYWVFVAFKGLGEDMNKTLRQHGIHYRVNESLGLTLCILHCASLIPYVNYLTGLATLFVLIFFLKSVKDGAAALLERTDTGH